MKRYEGKLLLRSAVMQDINEVQELVTACDVDEFGTADFAINMTETFQSVPLDKNTWIVYTEDNKIIGHAYMEEMGRGRLDTYVFTHPEYKGLGAGTLLVESTEKRALQYIEQYKKENITYEFNNIIPAGNASAADILERRGYKFKRLYSEMSIRLNGEPGEAVILENIFIRKYSSAEDAGEAYGVYCEAFQDARSHRIKPFEEWMNDRLTEGSDFDLWYLAYENDKPVGFIIGRNEASCTWVDLLGVSRSARRQGVGKALLQLIFKESYNRGVHTIGLNVDADSPTNAHKLYERVGMKPVFQIAMYEKKL